MKINKIFSSEPRIYDCDIKVNLSISPETIPILIPQKSLKAIQEIKDLQGFPAQDPNPYYITEEIKDITKLANGVEFVPDFWESYFDVMKKHPIPGRKKGHIPPYSFGTPENDFYTVGGKIEGKKVFLRIYIPPDGFETSNKGFIRDIKAGLVHFSVVAYTEDVIERDENGTIKSIKAIRTVKGSRNDAVEIGMGAMEQKVNKQVLNIISILKKEEFDFNELKSYLNIDSIKYNPYPNEHSARIRNPGNFQKESFRRINITSGVDAIIGRLKGKKTTTTQAYRFNAKKFTVKQAKTWLKEHNITYISFEPASGKSEKTEVYIMAEHVYKEIIENLKNQVDNGTVAKSNICKDLGIEIVTDEQKAAVKTLKEIVDITGKNPVEKVKQMRQNEETVKQQAYKNLRKELMTKEFGPEEISIDGKKKQNLKRIAAESLVKNEIQEKTDLEKQIEEAKENPVVKNLSFQQADVNSDFNEIKIQNAGKEKGRQTEYVKI